MANNKIQNEGNLELCVFFFACYSRDRKLVCFFLLYCHLNIIDKKRELNALNLIGAKVCFCRFFLYFPLYPSLSLPLSRIVKPHEHCDTNALHSTKQTIAVDCCVVACDFVFSGKNIQRDNQFMIWNCSNGNAQVSRNVGGFFLQRWLNSIWHSPNSNEWTAASWAHNGNLLSRIYLFLCIFFTPDGFLLWSFFCRSLHFFTFAFFPTLSLWLCTKNDSYQKDKTDIRILLIHHENYFFFSVHVPFDFAVYSVIFSFFSACSFLMSVTWAANQR